MNDADLNQVNQTETTERPEAYQTDTFKNNLMAKNNDSTAGNEVNIAKGILVVDFVIIFFLIKNFKFKLFFQRIN